MRLIPDNLISLGFFGTEEEAHDSGLVVLSQREPYWVWQDEEGSFQLLVRRESEIYLREQLDLYQKESINWPPPEVTMTESAGASFFPALLWIVVLVLSYRAQERWAELLSWGRVSSEAILSGEWYRTLSALFLHADIGHLTGNALFGALFVYLLTRQNGPLTAILGTILAGTAGNLLNAVFYSGTPHYSIGASTAVFGSVGILVAVPVGFALRHRGMQSVRTWGGPLITGVIVLAWFGTGSEWTDTTAHLAGFLCGLPIGLMAGFFKRAL